MLPTTFGPDSKATEGEFAILVLDMRTYRGIAITAGLVGVGKFVMAIIYKSMLPAGKKFGHFSVKNYIFKDLKKILHIYSNYLKAISIYISKKYVSFYALLSRCPSNSHTQTNKMYYLLVAIAPMVYCPMSPKTSKMNVFLQSLMNCYTNSVKKI
jgi:hypothetical protein